MIAMPDAVTSYWMQTEPGRQHPPLTADARAEVAVVGAGIAGICTAWELARAGRSVILLEADQVCAGVTGNTTAKLTSLHTLIYHHLASSLGGEAAMRYAQSQQDAIGRVGEIVAELGIDCELEPRAAYTYCESPRLVQDIRREVAAARRAGLPAEFVTETGLPYPIAGAVRVADQAQFHPRKYLTALVDDLLRLGGQVFEQTRVTKVDEGEPCRLSTDRGHTVTADDVVIATHYPILDRALLFPRLTPRRELVVAAAVPADRDPGGMYLTTEDNTRSVRTAPLPDGRRLLIVTGEAARPGTPGVAARFDRLAGWTRRRFDVETIDYRWAAQDNRSSDRVPYVGRLRHGAEHAWVATGFGGWGMTNGVMAGRLLTALITGQPEPPWTKLYDPRRIHPIVEAVPVVKSNFAVAKHYLVDRLHTRPEQAITELRPDEAAVINVGGKRCAVYRDSDGVLHVVSATCTHLGCVVGFNDAERSWDCPCHGSRFSPDGSVLHGPATEPLKPMDTPAVD